MKVRTDYVTNSSSSSYIIAFKDMPEVDAETIKKYPWIEKYAGIVEKVLTMEGYNETSEGTIISTIEELNEYFIDRYCWYGANGKSIEEALAAEDDDTKELYKKFVDYFNSGYKILDKSIDYCDDGYLNIVKEICDGENVIMLSEED